MFAGEVVDTTEDRHVRIDLVFGRDVDEIVIFNIEVRTAKIQLLARVDELRFDGRPQFSPPEVRTGNVNFVARPARQTRALRLRDVRVVGLFRLEISVTRGKNEILDRRCAQFRLHALRFRSPEIQRLEKSVESDHVRQIVVKISRADRYTPIPKSLLNARVPSKILFRIEIGVVSENFILAARRTKSRGDAGVQRRVRLVDLVTARDTISPNVAKLIEMIDSSTGDEDQIVNRRQRRL